MISSTTITATTAPVPDPLSSDLFNKRKDAGINYREIWITDNFVVRSQHGVRLTPFCDYVHLDTSDMYM